MFVAVCLIIGLALALISLSKEYESSTATTNNQTAAMMPDGTINGADAARQATIPAERPDFVITDALLSDRSTWENVAEGPINRQFCEGSMVRLSNATAKAVTLSLVPAESDASENLGIVRPGGTISFDPGDAVTWRIVDADAGSPLFQYEVTECRNGNSVPRASEAANEKPIATVFNRQGKCQVVIASVNVLNGPCYFATEKGGSFAVADAADRSGHIVRVEVNGPTAEGSWNGAQGAVYDNQPLGILTREGACWSNAESRVCLWAD